MVLRTRLALLAAAVAAVTLLSACGGDDGGKASGSAGANSGGGNTGGSPGSGGATTGSGTTGGTGGATTTTSSTPTGCQSNTDCAKDPNGPICNAMTGQCVGCIPQDDPVKDCGIGSWCVPNKGQCEAGCTANDDCPPMNGVPLVCDMDKHVCVGCVNDDSCPVGSICVGQTCVPGCSPSHACQPGQSCCGQQCFDLLTDENNCGACNTACNPIPHASVVCLNGQCSQSKCDANYADCNGNPMDGCETNTLVDGPCTCTPGAKQSCYLGAPGTLGKGLCKAGTQTCAADGLSWGACNGQVLPVPEICGNGIDEDCNGVVDDAKDMDGDGWTTCEGDCNDADPLVNPGALEVTYTVIDNGPGKPPTIVPGGNGVDDDCDPSTPDNMDPPACSAAAAKIKNVTGMDIANAMDLCQTTTANAPKPQKKWGVLAADFKLGSGADPGGQLSNFQNYQAAVMTQYGYLNGNPATPNNPPHKGPTMAGISSGRMRWVGQTDYVVPQSGSSFASPSACPAGYLAAHGGTLPSSQGCSGNCSGGNTCNDSIELKLQIRVPTNAKSMSYDFRFFSAEYPEYVCTTFNDFYLALLTTGAAGIPADKNVSFDGLGNAVSVNNGFFDVCQAAGCFACPAGAGGLAGTGMDGGIGGGTSWLTTDAPVVPGETMTLELMVFDVGDNIFDSLAVLDNFRWGLNTTSVKTHN
jgi:hypothetical protein